MSWQQKSAADQKKEEGEQVLIKLKNLKGWVLQRKPSGYGDWHYINDFDGKKNYHQVLHYYLNSIKSIQGAFVYRALHEQANICSAEF